MTPGNTQPQQPACELTPHHGTQVLAFAGPKGCGKTEAAKYLLARNSLSGLNYFTRLNLADPMKACCIEAFGLTWDECEEPQLKEQQLDRWPHLTPREIMQKVPEALKKTFGDNLWIMRWLSTAQDMMGQTGCIVLADLRFPEEAKILGQLKAKIIYIQNDAAEERLAKAKEAGDPKALHPSEAHYDYLRSISHATVDNNGSIEDLYTNVARTAKSLLGDWRNWDVPTTSMHKLRTGEF